MFENISITDKCLKKRNTKILKNTQEYTKYRTMLDM